MKIVIDVPEAYVDLFQEAEQGSIVYYTVRRAIKNSTSLENVFDDIKKEIRVKLEEPQYQHEGEDWRVGLIEAESIIDEYTIKKEANNEQT